MKKSLLGLALANPVVATQEAASVDLDGTNDYFSRASDFTGNADSKTFTFSAWVYGVLDATDNILMGTTSGGSRFALSQDNTEYMTLIAKNPSNTTILNIRFAATDFVLNTWNHILVSIDMANTSNRYVYVNDSAFTPTYTTYSNDNIDFTNTAWGIGGTPAVAQFKGRLSNVFLSREYLDLSIESNRRIFTTIDPDKGLIPNPNQLADYNSVAGNVTFYFPMDDPTTAHINAAGNGDMVQNGTIGRSNRGPNQYNAVASEFDGVGDYLSNAAISAPVDGKSVTMSFNYAVGDSNKLAYISGWKTGTSKTQWIFSGRSGNSANKPYLSCRNASNQQIFDIEGSTEFTSQIGKNISCQIAVSWNGGTFVYKLFVNGIEDTAAVFRSFRPVTDDIDWSSATDWEIMKNSTVYFDGNAGELYVSDEYIDLSTNNPFWEEDE